MEQHVFNDNFTEEGDTEISSKLNEEPNKLECYIMLGWKGLSGTNTPDYWANS